MTGGWEIHNGARILSEVSRIIREAPRRFEIEVDTLIWSNVLE
jgi:hypothetical protein